MAKRKYKWKNLNQTMEGIRIQVIDSLDYCMDHMPRFSNPTEMFDYLRLMTTYKDDPPGIELIQSVPTLFEDNYWGTPGAGDCDCFTVLTISMCIVHGWNDNRIHLVGRSSSKAVHVYSSTIFDGSEYVLDLTNPYVNIERSYKFKQKIDI